MSVWHSVCLCARYKLRIAFLRGGVAMKVAIEGGDLEGGGEGLEYWW